MRGICLIVCLLVLGSMVGAQVFYDDFSKGLTGWTMHGGTWTITKTEQLQADPKSSWQYLTWDSSSSLHGVVEVKVLYDTARKSLQFGGCALRFVKNGDCVMNKTQDNNSSGDFDRFFVYDQPGGSNYADPKAHTSAIVRLTAINADLIGEIDIDMDGKWDNTVVRKSLKKLVAGKAGIAGYGGALFDDFRYFDAVMRLHPNSPKPEPGKTIGIQIGGTPGKRYQCAASFGTAQGVPLVDGRRIPLNVDSLMVLSFQAPTVFGAFFGTTNSNGIAVSTVAIPSGSVLKGLHFYVGGVTIDTTQRTGIGNISNDLRIDIQ